MARCACRATRAEAAALARSAGRALRAGASAAARAVRGTSAALRRTAAPFAGSYHHASDGLGRDPLFDDEQREADAEKARNSARPYSIAVGVLFLGFIIFAGINSLSNDSPGPVGLQEGKRLPAFAAPSAPGRSTAIPTSTRRRLAGSTCATRSGSATTSTARWCWWRGSASAAVTATRCSTRVERIRRRFPRVDFVGLDLRNSKDEARKAVEENGWGFPMAVDRDGAVGLLYSVGVGPTTFFAYRGGVLASKALGELSEEELIDRIRRLERTSRKRENGARIEEPGGS